MKYVLKFVFKNGVSGKAVIDAPTDKIAFTTGAQMMANCEFDAWDICKAEGDNPTCTLFKELAKREGVQHIEVEPHVPIEVNVGGKVVCGKDVGDIDSGPCHILVVYD